MGTKSLFSQATFALTSKAEQGNGDISNEFERLTFVILLPFTICSLQADFPTHIFVS